MASIGFWTRNCVFSVPAGCEITVNLEGGYAERFGARMSSDDYLAEDIADNNDGPVNIGRPGDFLRRILETVSAFYCLGAEISWENVYSGIKYERAALPLYPLRRNVLRASYSFEEPLSSSCSQETFVNSNTIPSQLLVMRGLQPN